MIVDTVETIVIGADMILTDVELASCATLVDAEQMIERKIANLRMTVLRHVRDLWSATR